MKKLMLRCKPLDKLLDGGIESSSITEIYGEAGSGKTNLCLQAARECVLNNSKKVAYIDTEGISIERLKQICHGFDYKKILNNILFFSPTSLREQEKTVEDIIKIDNIDLIIIDTINMLYRLDAEEKTASRSLIRQITDLQLTARKKDLYVLLTAQVYTDENGNIKPFAVKDIEHMIKTIIKLERIKKGERQATIIKHSSQLEGKKTMFTITTDGLK